MRIQLSFIFSLLFLTNNLAWTEPLKPSNIDFIEVMTEVKMKNTWLEENLQGEGLFLNLINMEDMKISAAEAKSEVFSMDGKGYYQITFTQKLLNKQVLKTTSLVEMGENIKAISYNYVRKGAAGEEIERRKIHFDNPAWNYPEDTYTFSMLNMFFSSIINKNIKKSTFHLWFEDTVVLGMKLKVRGKKQIHIPLGDFNCINIRMTPDLSNITFFGNFGKIFVRLFQPFMPEIDFWLWEKEPYYPILKVENTGFRTGKSSMEVIEIKNRPSSELSATDDNKLKRHLSIDTYVEARQVKEEK